MPKHKQASRPSNVDRFPNDPLEVAVLIVATIGIAGGLFSLWYLAHINGAI